MVRDFINPVIFWEYDLEGLDLEAWANEWPAFVIKEVFNRNVGSQPAAMPSLMAFYGRDMVEKTLLDELWLTTVGIGNAQRYYPHLRKADFKAYKRIRNRQRQLARVGEYNPKL